MEGKHLINKSKMMKYKGSLEKTYIKIILSKLENLEEMDKFLDAHKKPKLNHQDINHLNRQIKSNKNEIVIKSLPTKKKPGPDGFMTEFYQTFKDLKPILPKLF
jgi:hypothetical protein